MCRCARAQLRDAEIRLYGKASVREDALQLLGDGSKMASSQDTAPSRGCLFM